MAASSSDASEPVKYRTSCDRCQNIKLRCSQEKPACKRCASKGFHCVYSPVRRMGRPKKPNHIASSKVSNLHESISTPDMVTPTPPGSILVGSRQEHSDDPSANFAGIGSGLGTATTPQNNARSWDPDHAGTLAIVVQDGSDAQTYHSSYPMSHDSPADHSEPQQAGVSPWVPIPMQTSTSTPGTFTPKLSSRGTIQTFGEALPRPVSLGPTADCYTAILTRTASLEQSLLVAPRAPPIDLMLEAERDLRALKQRLFSCAGHTHSGRECLASDRPALLSLAMLAERVVTMLEETFRFAAARATATSAMLQDPCGNPLPGPMARRLERSFRGLLEMPCVFPIQSGDLAIRVDDFMVDKTVKARAVKSILQLRIRKLRSTLEDMGSMPQRSDRKDSLSGPLDWGGSEGVLDDAARLLVEDLIRRMEALQGGMALMG
ncbi:hypothetical protein GGS26DRAFT_308215 [Hypomontagnella submonticulosa]|nr:hypothetical protein GGS26DRAFT_308215 [Hypomontagnella submonticulosa]